MTKNLLLINTIVWIATIVLKMRGIDLERWLALHYWQGSDFNLAQLLTYMFMHDTSRGFASFSHLFFNMFSLWMFGRIVEQVWGARRFLTFYLVCGVGAALVQELCYTLTWEGMLADLNHMTVGQLNEIIASGGTAIQQQLDAFYNSLLVVGASGSVFGVLLAFGMLFPNMRMYIIPFPFPVKAKWVVIGYGALELFFGVTGTMGSVAHFAHLGGMLFGFIMIMMWRHKGEIGGGNGYY